MQVRGTVLGKAHPVVGRVRSRVSSHTLCKVALGSTDRPWPPHRAAAGEVGAAHTGVQQAGHHVLGLGVIADCNGVLVEAAGGDGLRRGKV